MGVLVTSMHKWLKINNENCKNIIARIPIATKGLPSSRDEFVFGNTSTGIKFKWPIKGELEESIKCCRTAIKSNLSMLSIIARLNSAFIFSLFPLAFLRHFIENAFDVDVDLSNFPFSNKPFKFCGRKVIEFRAFINKLYNCNLVVLAITYNNKFTFSVNINNKLKINPQELVDTITSYLEN